MEELLFWRKKTLNVIINIKYYLAIEYTIIADIATRCQTDTMLYL